jgi:DNA-binding transcriptional ArsR family regulator
MTIRTHTRQQKALRRKAELLRILGHPTRIAIVQKLAKGPKCVTDIQELDIRPKPEHIIAWASEAGLASSSDVIELPPWHYGLILRT